MADLKKRCIKAVLRIGVTGHRALPDEALVRSGVREVLDRLGRLPGGAHSTFVVISPIAEGSDRIVAEEVLGRPGCVSRLEAVLPLPEEDYVADFQAAGSRAAFARLKGLAASVVSLQDTPAKSDSERQAAYEAAGRYIVDYCDVLVAVWDGLPSRGRGGTAEIVRYADSLGRPYFRISPETGEIVEKWPDG